MQHPVILGRFNYSVEIDESFHSNDDDDEFKSLQVT